MMYPIKLEFGMLYHINNTFQNTFSRYLLMCLWCSETYLSHDIIICNDFKSFVLELLEESFIFKKFYLIEKVANIVSASITTSYAIRSRHRQKSKVMQEPASGIYVCYEWKHPLTGLPKNNSIIKRQLLKYETNEHIAYLNASISFLHFPGHVLLTFFSRIILPAWHNCPFNL